MTIRGSGSEPTYSTHHNTKDKGKEMQRDNIRGKQSSSSAHHRKSHEKKEFTISQLRQVVAEARGSKPTGFAMKPDEKGWTQARSRSAEKREREDIAEYVNEKIRKKKKKQKM